VVQAKVPGLRNRTIATAGATVVMLSLPLVAPVMSAAASPQSQLPALLSKNRRPVAVVDPVTGLLIHPLTGVVIDLANVIYDPTLGQYIDRTSGAIIPTDGSIPGLPLLQPSSPRPGIAESPGSVNRQADKASPLPATPRARARPAQQSPEAASDGESSPSPPAQQGLLTPQPRAGRSDKNSTFLLPPPATVIASVVDLVLGDSETQRNSYTGASGSADLGDGGTATPAPSPGAPRGAGGAASTLSATHDVDAPHPPGGASPEDSHRPQALPSPDTQSQVTDTSIEFAEPPARARDLGTVSISRVVDTVPSWLLLTAGGLLVLIGGVGLIYSLRRRHSR
jgi:hypothetical protein